MAPNDPISGFHTPELSTVRLAPVEESIDQLLDINHPAEPLFNILSVVRPLIHPDHLEDYDRLVGETILGTEHAADTNESRSDLRSLLSAEAQNNPDLAFRLAVLAHELSQLIVAPELSVAATDPRIQTTVRRFMVHFEPLRLSYQSSLFHSPLSWVGAPAAAGVSTQLSFTHRLAPTVGRVWNAGITAVHQAAQETEVKAVAAENAGDDERAAEIRRQAPVYLAPENEVEGALEILGYLNNPPTGVSLSEFDRVTLQREAVLSLEGHYLNGNNVHAFTNRADLLGNYFQARHELELARRIVPYAQHQPGLLANVEATERTLFFTFSGQGSAYLDELRGLYNTYPSLRPFIESQLHNIREQSLSAEATEAHYYLHHGFDALTWITDPNSVPPQNYLDSVPISMPLIYVTQVANYLLMLENGWSTQDIIGHAEGMTGYSQGVSTATLVAMGLEGDAFSSRAMDMGTFMFWQGLRQQAPYQQPNISLADIETSIKAGEGHPSPMVSVIGLPLEEVQTYAARANRSLPSDEQIEVALESTFQRTIASGPASSLIHLRNILRARQAADAKSQQQGRLEGAALTFTWEYLPTSGQFHHSERQRLGAELLLSDMDRLGISFSGDELQVPVYSTLDGSNLQDTDDVTAALVNLQFTDHMMFRAAMRAAQTDRVGYSVDLGSGDLTARSARSVVRGFGPHVVAISSRNGRAEVFDTRVENVPEGENWSRFRPGLVRLPNGSVELDTRLTRFTGRRPIIGGGMTPTTVEIDLTVTAEAHSNIVELAGGGQVTEAILRSRLDEAVERLAPGQGIVLNMLFLDPYLWGLQYPLLPQLRAEGYPIVGATVSAGVPPVGQATDILDTLNASGIWMNSFKPGTVDQIDAVLAIAEANPHREIIMQIEGGKAGGHHSWEDLNNLLRARYAQIRQHDNVILVVGGGIHSAPQSLDYLEGTWNAEGAPMPVDGIILGTRLMAAEEAHTSPSVKDHLVSTPGTDEWVYTGQTVGGMTSGHSNLDASIHYTVNAASQLSTRLDRMWADSGNDPEKFEAMVVDNHDAIVAALADTQKPYFGDLGNMTYSEVLSRMTELMAVGRNGRYEDGSWLDVSYRQRVFDWASRAENRLTAVPLGATPPVAFVQSLDQLDDPQAFVTDFTERFPKAGGQVLHPEDVGFFLDRVARRPGKPVNFVPVIDRNVRKWFKSDSLWQAHDDRLAASAILTIPGPEAVQGITVANEPVNDIFGDFNTYVIAQVEDRLGAGDIPNVSAIGAVPVQPLQTEGLRGISVSEDVESSGTHTAVVTNAAVVDVGQWFRFLSNRGTGALRSIFTGRSIAQGTAQIDNYVRDLFQPRDGEVVSWDMNDAGQLTRLVVSEPASGTEAPLRPRVTALLLEDESGVSVTLHHYTPRTQALGVTSREDLSDTNPVLAARRIDLPLYFAPTGRLDAPLSEVMESRDEAIRLFQQRTWFADETHPALDGTLRAYTNVTADHIRGFVATTRPTNSGARAHLQGVDGRLVAPWSMLNTFAWPALIGSLFSDDINGNLHRLVYLSTDMERLSEAPIQEGDQLQTEMRIVNVTNNDSGKVFRVTGTVSRLGDGLPEPIAELSSEFFIRQNFSTEPIQRWSERTDSGVIAIDSDAKRGASTIAVLEDKDWLTLNDDVTLEPGDQLAFGIVTRERAEVVDGTTVYTYDVNGTVSRGGEQVGTISYAVNQSGLMQNPVTFYLDAARVADEPMALPTGGYTLFSFPTQAPQDNRAFSPFSGDLNAIHDDHLVAGIADLPTTITPGRWLESHAEAMVNRWLLDPSRIHATHVSYEGMVNPGERLTVTGRHVANHEGRMVLEVKMNNGEGRTVFNATYEVDQPETAYVFTGQGVPVEQLQNMGMDDYANSPAAKAIWDEADQYSRDNFGFSILDLVRRNPDRVVNPEYFRFQRLFRGRADTNLNTDLIPGRFFTQVTTDNGDALYLETTRNGRDLRIRGEGNSHLTFVDDRGLEVNVPNHLEHPKGVLSLTQFTQMATMVLGVATRAKMDEVGVRQDDAVFAGHSLGEYIALAAMTDFSEVGPMMELVYYRGVTMQNYVERDAAGVSPYVMYVVRPNLHGWSEGDLEAAVAQAASETSQPLEVVNYNVHGRQYSVTGHQDAMARFTELAREAYLARGGDPSRTPWAVLNVDVPFHSGVLRPGIDAFRRVLDSHFGDRVNPDQLVGRYIPNLTGSVFRLEREFVEEAKFRSPSQVFTDVLRDWDTLVQDPGRLTRTLLIELLANQFASPVRWSQTQAVLLGSGQPVDRLVEVGPKGGVLTGMAQATLGLDGVRVQQPTLLHTQDTPNEVYFLREDTAEEEVVASAPSAVVGIPVVATPAQVVTAPAPAAAVATAGSPLTALTQRDSIEQALITILSINGNVAPSQINLDADMDSSLFPGQSALRNDAVANVATEFNVSGIDGAHEMPLRQLVDEIDKRVKNYGPDRPGPYLRSLHKQQLKVVIGGAKISLADLVGHLTGSSPGQWSLPADHAFAVVNSVVLFGRSGDSNQSGALSNLAPASRLKDPAEAITWVNSVVQQYAQDRGISVAQVTASGGGGDGMMMDEAALDEMLAKYFGFEGVFARTARFMLNALGIDPYALVAAADEELVEAAEQGQLYSGQYGPKVERVIRPQFDANRAMVFGSEWATARRQVTQLYNALQRGDTFEADAIDATIAHLAGNADQALLNMARHYEGRLSAQGHEIGAAVFGQLATQVAANVGAAPMFVPQGGPVMPSVRITDNGTLEYSQVPRTGVSDWNDFVDEQMGGSPEHDIFSYASIRTPSTMDSSYREPNYELSQTYFEAMRQLVTEGRSFQGQTFLVTGAGKEGIALDMARMYLAGGGRVVLTTSSYNWERVQFYQSVYQESAANGAELVVVPFSQGAAEDPAAMMDWIFRDPSAGGLGWVVDHLIPFGATHQLGTMRQHSDQEVATMEVMVHGPERLIAALADQYEQHGINPQDHRFNVLLPYSPNLGTMGNDGMYGEAKAALVAILNKVGTEAEQDWAQYARVALAEIGWTRGTALMEALNHVAPHLESQFGARTYSQPEMALMLATALLPEVMAMGEENGLYLDLLGGFDRVPNMSQEMSQELSRLGIESARRRAVHEARAAERVATHGEPAELASVDPKVLPDYSLPHVPSAERLASLPDLTHLDPSQVVVVVGYGEYGPYGRAHSRFQAETGDRTLSYYVEKAWDMGFIRYERSGEWVGWVDAQSGDPVADHDIPEQYGEQIDAGTGVRPVNPAVVGFDPKNIVQYQEVTLTDNWTFSVDSHERAQGYVRHYGDQATYRFDQGKDLYEVTIKEGNAVRVPGRVDLDRWVAGQIPDGFDATRYGIPTSMVSGQAPVDRLTLLNIIATVEALVSAGMSPEEIFAYIHVNRIGITQGSGMGGATAMAGRPETPERPAGGGMMIDHLLDQPRNTPELQETLGNDIAAWVMQSIFGGCGTTTHPVGACATAGVSMELGVEKILSGENDMVVVGGFDDYTRPGAVGFADMQATSSSDELVAAGYPPHTHSMPNDRDRAGFMEGQGAGTQILMRADRALEMGLPVYAIVAFGETHADGFQGSIPSPGQGLLAVAARTEGAAQGLTMSMGPETYEDLLDINYRRAMIAQFEGLRGNPDVIAAVGGAAVANRMVDEAINFYAHGFANPRDSRGRAAIAPLEGALSIYGMDIDDIDVANFHNTSTPANDRNEGGLWQGINTRLGRTPGNPLVVVSQKWILGHHKGGAAAPAINAGIQMMQSGTIPGNRNLRDVDPEFRGYDTLLYTNETLHRNLDTDPINAVATDTLGFGHVGNLAVTINPDYFFAMLTPAERAAYLERRAPRERARFQQEMALMTGSDPYYTLQNRGPYVGDPNSTDAVERQAYRDHEADVIGDPSLPFDVSQGRYLTPGEAVALSGMGTPDARAVAAMVDGASDSSVVTEPRPVLPFNPEFVTYLNEHNVGLDTRAQIVAQIGVDPFADVSLLQDLLRRGGAVEAANSLAERFPEHASDTARGEVDPSRRGGR